MGYMGQHEEAVAMSVPLNYVDLRLDRAEKTLAEGQTCRAGILGAEALTVL